MNRPDYCPLPPHDIDLENIQSEVPGVYAIPNIISQREHDYLVSKFDEAPGTNPTGPYVLHKGSTYGSDAHPVPDWLDGLGIHVQDTLKAHDLPTFQAYPSEEPMYPNEMVTHEYQPGQGIGWIMYPPDMGSRVGIISLVSNWAYRFRTGSYTDEEDRTEETIDAPPRSLILTTGASLKWRQGFLANDPCTKDKTTRRISIIMWRQVKWV